MLRRVAIVAALLTACGSKEKPVASPDACAGTETKGPLRWFEDNWAGAVACAKQKNIPIVLDLWAPWCHTCISMQTTVFTDPSLATKADRFVWAALDADKAENAVPVGKFATSAMPTFYVIGPDEQVLRRFVGAATLQQFHEFVDGTGTDDTHMLAAERALAAKDLATGEQELDAALKAAPPAWPRRAEALASLQLTRKKRGDHAGCAVLSAENLDAVGKTAIATNFYQVALEWATETKDTALRDRAITALKSVLADPTAPLSVDDRAEALGYLRDALDETGDDAGATEAAEQARKLLDDAFAAAPTAFQRMTYIWPRAEVYAYLERPLDLVADYAKLSAELPTEYDPPARLGWLYLQARKYPEAAQWTDKALALVYGPRKARLLSQRAEIAAGAGDKATERAMREQAVKLWESLPPGQQNADSLAKAKAALAALQ